MSRTKHRSQRNENRISHAPLANRERWESVSAAEKRKQRSLVIGSRNARVASPTDFEDTTSALTSSRDEDIVMEDISTFFLSSTTRSSTIDSDLCDFGESDSQDEDEDTEEG